MRIRRVNLFRSVTSFFMFMLIFCLATRAQNQTHLVLPHAFDIEKAIFSKNDSLIVAGCADNVIRIIDKASSLVLMSLMPDFPIEVPNGGFDGGRNYHGLVSFDISDDNKYVVASYENSGIWMWNIRNSTTSLLFEQFNDSTEKDKAVQRIRIHDESIQLNNTISYLPTNDVYDIWFSNDNSRILGYQTFYGDVDFLIIELPTIEKNYFLFSNLTQVPMLGFADISSDGNLAAIVDTGGRVFIWDIANQLVRDTIQFDSESTIRPQFMDVTHDLILDGGYSQTCIARYPNYDTITYLDSSDSWLYARTTSDEFIFSELSPDNKSIARISGEDDIIIWDAQSGRIVDKISISDLIKQALPDDLHPFVFPATLQDNVADSFKHFGTSDFVLGNEDLFLVLYREDNIDPEDSSFDHWIDNISIRYNLKLKSIVPFLSNSSNWAQLPNDKVGQLQISNNQRTLLFENNDGDGVFQIMELETGVRKDLDGESYASQLTWNSAYNAVSFLDDSYWTLSELTGKTIATLPNNPESKVLLSKNGNKWITLKRDAIAITDVKTRTLDCEIIFPEYTWPMFGDFPVVSNENENLIFVYNDDDNRKLFLAGINTINNRQLPNVIKALNGADFYEFNKDQTRLFVYFKSGEVFLYDCASDTIIKKHRFRPKWLKGNKILVTSDNNKASDYYGLDTDGNWFEGKNNEDIVQVSFGENQSSVLFQSESSIYVYDFASSDPFQFKYKTEGHSTTFLSEHLIGTAIHADQGLYYCLLDTRTRAITDSIPYEFIGAPNKIKDTPYLEFGGMYGINSIWSLESDSFLISYNDQLTSIQFSPANDFLISSVMGSDTHQLINLKTDERTWLVASENGYDSNISFMNDSILVLIQKNAMQFYNCRRKQWMFTRITISNSDWLIYDSDFRFEGTDKAIDKLYFVCGLEIIELAQMKDSLWVPGLADKIINGSEILIDDKPAPKLSELNICDLTPIIQRMDQIDERILKYRILPRRGGLGDTELYINGIPTYTYSPETLEKKFEQTGTVFYLTINTDSLQEFLYGTQHNTNSILLKSKVKGNGISGRGNLLPISKTSNEGDPHFYGVFIGVNDYGNEQGNPSDQNYKNLDFAAKDANDLSVAVELAARNLFKDNCHIYHLTGKDNLEPTKANMKGVLNEIGLQSNSSDVLYIFFAGHGDVMLMKDTLNEEVAEKNQIRFMLQRAEKANPISTSFGIKELSEWCHPRNIKAQKRVFVFDACQSGQYLNEAFRGDNDDLRIRQLDKLKNKNGMMILAAAAADESAYEDETLNQGVLTYHLLQVMLEHGDTSLTVRDWFDKTIDYVKDYSRLSGMKQEPSSFGDGYFDLGNITSSVRESIKITCPLTRVGACEILAGSDEADVLFPNAEDKILKYFSEAESRGNLVYSKKSDRAYRAVGSFDVDGDKVSVRYRIKLGDRTEPWVKIPVARYQNEDELVQVIVSSISQEIEVLSKQEARCKLRF